MHQSDLQFLLFLSVVIIVLLIIKHYRSKSQFYRLQSQVPELVKREFDAWRSREIDAVRSELRQAAQMEAAADLKQWRLETEQNIRTDAARRSAAITQGKVTEHLAPYFGGFPYNFKDLRFLGTPVDLIVFDGMSDGVIREIVFLEIKTGSSTLTSRERHVRDAVLEKRVTWDEFRVGEA